MNLVYLIFLDCILNRTTSTNETWFFATDYEPYKSYFKSNLPFKQINFHSINSSSNTEQCSNVQQALIELWLLTKCQQLFLTHWSSFSWLASSISQVHPVIIKGNTCHIQPFSRPCYYELTHLKQLSCYNYESMLRNDKCCQSENFCNNDCLHHSSKYGAHRVYFLVIWPMLPLLKWSCKWLIISCVIIFIVNQMICRKNSEILMNFYKKLILVVMFVCIVFIDVRCLFWSKIKTL